MADLLTSEGNENIKEENNEGRHPGFQRSHRPLRSALAMVSFIPWTISLGEGMTMRRFLVGTGGADRSASRTATRSVRLLMVLIKKVSVSKVISFSK